MNCCFYSEYQQVTKRIIGPSHQTDTFFYPIIYALLWYLYGNNRKLCLMLYIKLMMWLIQFTPVLTNPLLKFNYWCTFFFCNYREPDDRKFLAHHYRYTNTYWPSFLSFLLATIILQTIFFYVFKWWYKW